MELIRFSSTSSNITCVEVNSSLFFDPMDNNWLVLVPVILYCLSFTLSFYTAMEFFIAQSPFQIKGFIFCLLAGCVSIFACIGFFPRKIIQLYPINVPPGCAFYHHIIYFFFAIVAFILYVFDFQVVQVEKKR